MCNRINHCGLCVFSTSSKMSCCLHKLPIRQCCLCRQRFWSYCIDKKKSQSTPYLPLQSAYHFWRIKEDHMHPVGVNKVYFEIFAPSNIYIYIYIYICFMLIWITLYEPFRARWGAKMNSVYFSSVKLKVKYLHIYLSQSLGILLPTTLTCFHGETELASKGRYVLYVCILLLKQPIKSNSWEPNQSCIIIQDKISQNWRA